MQKKNSALTNLDKDKTKSNLNYYLTSFTPIIIGYLTLLGYGAALLYQQNYNAYFFVPLSLVEITQTVVIQTAILSILIITSGFFYLSGTYRKLKEKIDDPIRVSLLLVVPFFLLFLAISFIIPGSLVSYIFSSVFGIVAIIIGFVTIFILPKKGDFILFKKSPKKKKKEKNAKEIKSPPPFIMVLTGGVMFIFIFALLGTLYARFQTKFIVSSCYENHILINLSSDNFAAVPYNAESKYLIDNIRIVPKVSENCSYSYIKTGRLINENDHKTYFGY